jgi:hypothetical protein
MPLIAYFLKKFNRNETKRKPASRLIEIYLPSGIMSAENYHKNENTKLKACHWTDYECPQFL